jgi:hypothetical protein
MSKKLHFSMSEDFARSDIQKAKRGLPARLEHELVYAASDEEKGGVDNCNFNWHV